MQGRITIDLKAEQIVTIEFVRGQTRDERPNLSDLQLDENDDYRLQKTKRDRLAAYERGEWHMRVLWVEAQVRVPMGGGKFALYELRSTGIWGIESDCGLDAEDGLWNKQEQELRATLKEMGAAFMNCCP